MLNQIQVQEPNSEKGFHATNSCLFNFGQDFQGFFYTQKSEFTTKMLEDILETYLIMVLMKAKPEYIW